MSAAQEQSAIRTTPQTTTTTTPTSILNHAGGLTAIVGEQNVTTTLAPRIIAETSLVQPPSFNGTGYDLDNDDVDNGFFAGFTDLQTLFLACFATLVPLFVCLGTAFALRLAWKRYKRSRECELDYEEGSLHGEASTEPLHSHLLNSDKVKCNDGQLSMDLDVRESSGTGGTSRTAPGSRGANNHCSANGSIITMTLKNNHLIVETEERNDLEDDSRETTMKYSPGARDGVFVVEVQQGMRRSPPRNNCNSHGALVHNPPAERYSDDEGDEHDARRACKTGLSQSNLSIASNHQNYRYGNQQGYDNGHYGYPVYNGYTFDEPPPRLEPNKPKITSAVYKPNCRLESSASIDAGPDGPLHSDVMMKELGLKNINDDAIQEEQRRLGNGVDQQSRICHNQIKEILPTTSSKFERLKNDLTADLPPPEKEDYQNDAFESS